MAKAQEIEMSSDMGPDRDSDTEGGTETQSGKSPGRREYIWRLRYLLILVMIGTLQHTVYPSVPYIINTFFASEYADVTDCEVVPDSKACRRGAVDAAFYHGWSDCLSHTGAMVMGVMLGSLSDSVGRRPFIIAAAVLGALPLLALAAHLWFGVSLWLYLAMVPVLEAFETNGIFLAVMADIIPNAEERSVAFATFIGAILIAVCFTLPIGFLAPKHSTLQISLAAAAVKLVYVFMLFPETLPSRGKFQEETEKSSLSFRNTAQQAFTLLTRNSFICKVALVLTVSGMAGSGYGIIMPPWITGYFGFRRTDKLIMGIAGITSVLICCGVALGKLVPLLGDVRVLQISCLFGLAFPLILPLATEKWMLWVLAFLFFGPCFVSLPVVAAIKSNLVSQDEQGLVQGAIASISKGAATLGYLIFGALFRGVTKGGKVASRSAALPAFLLIAGLNLVSTIVAWSLPQTPPPPPPSTAKATMQSSSDATTDDAMDEDSAVDSSSSSAASSASAQPGCSMLRGTRERP